jgi:hypothetical protein
MHLPTNPQPTDRPSSIAHRQGLVGPISELLEQIQTKGAGSSELDPGAAATILALGFYSPSETPQARSARLDAEQILKNIELHRLSPALLDELRILLPSQLEALETLRVVRRHENGTVLKLGVTRGESVLLLVTDLRNLMLRELAEPVVPGVTAQRTTPSLAEVSGPRLEGASDEVNPKGVRKQLRRLRSHAELIKDSLVGIVAFEKLAAIFSEVERPGVNPESIVRVLQQLEKGEQPDPKTETQRSLCDFFKLLVDTQREFNNRTGAKAEEYNSVRDKLAKFDRDWFSEHLPSRCLNLECFAGPAVRAALRQKYGTETTEVEPQINRHRLVIIGALKLVEELSGSRQPEAQRAIDLLTDFGEEIKSHQRSVKPSKTRSEVYAGAALYQIRFRALVQSEEFKGIQEQLKSAGAEVERQIAALVTSP